MALTITIAGSGTVAGAVYCPVASMVPQPAPEQPDPETLQTKLWLTPFGLLPSEKLTFALNCCPALIGTIGPGEKIVTATGPLKDDVVVEDGVVGVSRLPQAVSVSDRMTPRMRVARPMGPAFRKMRDDRDETVEGTLLPFRRQRVRARTCPHAEHPISRSAPANLPTGKTTRPRARVAAVIRSRNVGLAFDERQAMVAVASVNRAVAHHHSLPARWCSCINPWEDTCTMKWSAL